MKRLAIIIALISSFLLQPFILPPVYAYATDEKVMHAANTLLKNTATHAGYRILPSQLKALVDADINPVIVDIRSAKSFAEGHIPGVIHLPLLSLAETIAKNPAMLPLDCPIYVICCVKDIYSAYAVALLRMGGYDAYTIPGGMPAWADLGYPIVEGPADSASIYPPQGQAFRPDIEVLQQGDTFIQGLPRHYSYQLHIEELAERQRNKEMFSILDVRSHTADLGELFPGAVKIPLPELLDNIKKQPTLIAKDKPVIVLDPLDTQAAFAVVALRLAGYQAYMVPNVELGLNYTEMQ